MRLYERLDVRLEARRRFDVGLELGLGLDLRLVFDWAWAWV